MKRRHAMPFGAEVFASAACASASGRPPRARSSSSSTVRDSRAKARDVSARATAGSRSTVADAPAGTRYAFRIDGGLSVPDPASRCNPDDVHAPSMVVDPLAYDWNDASWSGRPWEDAVIYELHVGTFTPEGTFAAAIERLDYLAELGVTAVELMPIADFPGRRNWGYDGVLPFAPDATLRHAGRSQAPGRCRACALADGVPRRRLQPLRTRGQLPSRLRARSSSTPRIRRHGARRSTFDGEQQPHGARLLHPQRALLARGVPLRRLRLDAVHRIVDDSSPDILDELAARVREGPGRERHIHLVLENDRNAAHYLGRDAQQPSAARDRAMERRHASCRARPRDRRDRRLLRGLRRRGRSGISAAASPRASPTRASLRRIAAALARGEPSVHLPPAAFVAFLQTHDQVGNRAFGERIGHIADPRALRAAIACILLSPSPPLLFMGEEFAASTPFLFFCDFGPELADAVTQGRRRDFARFDRFRDHEARDAIPDPNRLDTSKGASSTGARSTGRRTAHGSSSIANACTSRDADRAAPRRHAAPPARFEAERGGVLYVDWTLGDGCAAASRRQFLPERAAPRKSAARRRPLCDGAC